MLSNDTNYHIDVNVILLLQFKLTIKKIFLILGGFFSTHDSFKVEDNSPSKQNTAYSITDSSNTNFDLSLSPEGKQTSLSPTLPLKLNQCLSNSLEDIRNGNQGGRSIIDKGKGRRRRRTTLPKRRFSDLHLHLLLCPTRSSFCGNGSSSDDMPLTTSPQRAHRSLPDSPSELDEVPSFCFDFLDKNSKDKVCSRFFYDFLKIFLYLKSVNDNPYLLISQRFFFQNFKQK